MILSAIFFSTPVFADTEDNKTNTIEIFDYAELFSEEEEKDIVNHIEDLSYSNYGIDVVVLTAKEYNGTIVTYTDDFYDNNNFGKDGILFFVNNDEVYINTTGYSIVAINDKEIQEIIDSGWNSFIDYDFVNCIKILSTNAANYIDIAYDNGYTDSSIDTDVVVPQVPIGEKVITAIVPTFMSIIFSGIVVTIVLAILNVKHNSVSKVKNANVYLKNDFTVNNSNTRFITTHQNVYRNYYRPSSSSSGGRSHSSGSHHRSSSGRSHGGGGRRRR
jgi:uncharacterized protein